LAKIPENCDYNIDPGFHVFPKETSLDSFSSVASIEMVGGAKKWSSTDVMII
jgi:hypothetical protein